MICPISIKHFSHSLCFAGGVSIGTAVLTAVRQDVNNLESFVVVQELEFATNLASYGLLWGLANQYILGSLSWRSLTPTENLRGNSFK